MPVDKENNRKLQKYKDYIVIAPKKKYQVN